MSDEVYNTLDMRVIALALHHRHIATKLRSAITVNPFGLQTEIDLHMKFYDELWGMLDAQEKDDEKWGFTNPTNIDGSMVNERD